MREIKFRSWLKIKKVMLIEFTMDNKLDSESEKNVLMQYTGLKDTNGKEIYEGDVIKGHTFDERINEKQIGEIAYNEDRHGFVFIPSRMKRKNLYYPLFSVVTCEVIGNIYENPELLEVQHD